MARESKSGGISFLGALQVLFIGLKLAGVIDWPWHLVLAPLIIEGVLILLALALLFIVDN